MRPFAPLVAACLLAAAVPAADPKPADKTDKTESANSKKELAGKWRLVSSTVKSDDLDEMKKLGIALGFEFTADGAVSMIILPLDDKAESKKAAAAAGKALADQGATGKYTLAAGDKVTLSGIKSVENGKDTDVTISVKGDEMTFKDKEDTLKLTRVK